jgi:fructose-bisphosphate aldolase class II
MACCLQWCAGEARKRLDVERIRQIKERTKAFLTPHGGSGTADADFAAGIHAGLNIIHINTELRVAWRRGLEEALQSHPQEVSPYKILPTAEQAVKKIVAGRLSLFHANSHSS